MKIINKLFFLYNNKSSFIIIFYFLFQKIKNIFIKRKIIEYKKKHQKLLIKKKFTKDYFSSHAYYFYYIINKIKNSENYLEIGSYEGNSALFVEENFNFNKIYCVDTWDDLDEYDKTGEYPNKHFSLVEQKFDKNLKEYKNIKKIKKKSNIFFKDNKIFYDIIYVDGLHKGEQVYQDCVNAWKFLNENGYLICDDYIWTLYKKIEDNPCYAINKFLKKINNQYKIIIVSNSQIYIKKLARARKESNPEPPEPKSGALSS